MLPHDLMLYCHHLEILSTFWTQGLHFHFTLGPKSRVTRAAHGISKNGFSSLCQVTKLSETNKSEMSEEFTHSSLNIVKYSTDCSFTFNKISRSYWGWGGGGWFKPAPHVCYGNYQETVPVYHPPQTSRGARESSLQAGSHLVNDQPSCFS